MDKFEQRRLALQALVDELGHGGIARIAKSIGKEASYVSRMLYPPGKSGAKRIGEDSRDLLAAAYPTHFQPSGNVIELPASSAPAPYEATGGGVVITQFDAGGGMDCNGHLLLEDQPGVIKSWNVDEDWLRLNVPVYSSLKNLCIVTGFGPSMRPMFNPGDPLLVDRGVNAVNHEGIYFFRVGDEGFIKIIQRVPEFDGPGFVYRIISKNPDYPPYDISAKNPHFQVIGKVLTVWRSEQF